MQKKYQWHIDPLTGQWVEMERAPPKTSGYSAIAYAEMSAPALEPMMKVFHTVSSGLSECSSGS